MEDQRLQLVTIRPLSDCEALLSNRLQIDDLYSSDEREDGMGHIFDCLQFLVTQLSQVQVAVAVAGAGEEDYGWEGRTWFQMAENYGWGKGNYGNGLEKAIPSCYFKDMLSVTELDVLKLKSVHCVFFAGLSRPTAMPPITEDQFIFLGKYEAMGFSSTNSTTDKRSLTTDKGFGACISFPSRVNSSADYRWCHRSSDPEFLKAEEVR
ncbi:hypothetical protein HS088_TW22G01223 [Tripterygium wilfordii]|uniref:Uncharacterized protein n=1 Tax=Tripterygium wilfordii TaxID=458696 RepID=A0A7J7C0A4_TRIWF|nr:hypothetical protein HS088_TW22G01223 [Tripterygium wilfordii]